MVKIILNESVVSSESQDDSVGRLLKIDKQNVLKRLYKNCSIKLYIFQRPVKAVATANNPNYCTEQNYTNLSFIWLVVRSSLWVQQFYIVDKPQSLNKR